MIDPSNVCDKSISNVDTLTFLPSFYVTSSIDILKGMERVGSKSQFSNK
jgi:hypothetical protein